MPPPSTSWDLVIRPKRGWLELHLGDLWRYRDLIGLFVVRDFVAYYKQTVLGPLWYIIQPLLTTAMFVVVFGQIAKLPTDGLPQPLFYLCGVTAWAYFADCLTKTSGTFITNASIFGKVYFPRLAVPLSLVISGLIRFAIQLGFFLAVLGYYIFSGGSVRPTGGLLLLPALILIMAGLGLGCGIIISALTTKYRDLQHLVAFGVQLAMYATPIVYPLSIVRGKFRVLVLLNPMTPVVETFRFAFLGSGTFAWQHLAYSGGITLFILAAGIILFNHVEKSFMDTV